MNKTGLITTLIVCIIIIGAVVSVVYFSEPEKEITELEIPLADDTNATAESVSSLVDALNDFLQVSEGFYDNWLEYREMEKI